MSRLPHVLALFALLCVSPAVPASVATPSVADCVVPIGSKQHYRHQWPLVFNLSGDLLSTTTTTVTTAADGDNKEVTSVRVAAGEEVLLSCAPNYLKRYHRQGSVTVRCNGASGNFTVLTVGSSGGVGETTERPTGGEYGIVELTCDLRVVEEVLTAVPGCSKSHWTATKFGYTHVAPQDERTLILGESCYDAVAGRTLFAHVRMGGDAYLQAEARTYLTAQPHPDGRYKIEFFRNLHFDEIYARLRNDLQQKRAPALKLTQYVDETLLPSAQLQAVKKLPWNYFVAYEDLEAFDALKQDIKARAESQPLDVYVGSHGVKTLLSAAGVATPIYVQQNSNEQPRFPLPSHIWLLVQATQGEQRAIVFVVPNADSNSLAVDGAAASPPLCHSDCAAVSWLQRANAKMPGLLCCSLKDAALAIEELQLLDVVANPDLLL